MLADMIFPPELQQYIYVLDDAPGAVEAIVRYCTHRWRTAPDILQNSTFDGVAIALEAGFGLDIPDTKLEKLG